jgi:hypothetical protein
MLRNIPSKWNGDMPLIVVGATDNFGNIWEGTQYEFNPDNPKASVSAWGPGDQIYCATQGEKLIDTSGTSASKLLEIIYFKVRV